MIFYHCAWVPNEIHGPEIILGTFELPFSLCRSRNVGLDHIGHFGFQKIQNELGLVPSQLDK